MDEIIIYTDDDGNITNKKNATKFEICTLDKNGRSIMRYYGRLDGKNKKPALFTEQKKKAKP